MVPDLGPTDGIVSGFLGSDGPDAVLEKKFHVRCLAWVCVCMPCMQVTRNSSTTLAEVYVLDLDQNNQPHY
jgi:hypothetical protein